MLDLLLRDARILTMDPRKPFAHAVGILHGRIVGLDAEVTDLRARRVINCQGATIVPGLGDAHNHMLSYGLGLLELDLSPFSTIEAVLDALSHRANTTPKGGWVIAHSYNDTRLTERLDRTMLDRVSLDHPIWIKHRSGHLAVVNSLILDSVRDCVADVDMAGYTGQIESGILRESAQRLAADLRGPSDLEEMVEALAKATTILASEGLTHVVECGIGSGLLAQSPLEALAYQIARERDVLKVRVDLMPGVDTLHPVGVEAHGVAARSLDLGLSSGFGDDRLRLGPLKVWLDGSLANRTAALSEPFSDGARTKGFLTEDPEAIKRILTEAHCSGWRIAAHAIGDEAIDLALDAIDEAQRRVYRPDARHRIEHAAVTRPDQLDRMSRVAVVPVPQAGFIREIGDDLTSALGERRTDWLYRHESFLRAGLRVPGSSDRPCLDGHPLKGMQSMVTRVSPSGRVVSPQERVDALTALRAYTVDEAWVCRDENRRGFVGSGAHADLAVLSDDPTGVSSEQIAAIDVLATLLSGGFTYQRSADLGAGE